MNPLNCIAATAAVALLAGTRCPADVSVLVSPSMGMSVTGRDDLAQLKHLASGVGWEFERNARTTAELKRIGIKSIRCINVDPLAGHFDQNGRFVVEDTGYITAHLETCQRVGASPHVIIATGIHEDIRLKAEDIEDADQGIMGLVSTQVFGPTDWKKFQAYCEAYFEYVLVTKAFPNARFEVANEPDIGGAVYPYPPKPATGSAALYEAYFNLYKNVAIAAERFEKSHPTTSVTLGGPALAWAFTFKYGDFNWAERFLRDCGERKVKLDFIGLHYYGNISSLKGEYSANYPPFTEMLQTTLDARDRYCPETPLWLTEWGASYQTDNTEPSAVNASNVGAAWAAAFLNLMLETGVDGALYLVTTDLRRQAEDGQWENVWGWPSLFVNRVVFGEAFPKAPFHVFDMISRLEGHRVEATCESDTVKCLASADPDTRKITLMVWNYGFEIPESGLGTENARRERVALRVAGASRFFGSQSVKMERWLVSENKSNAHHLFQMGEQLDRRAELHRTPTRTRPIRDGAFDVSFAMPPSSVSLVVLSAE